MIQTIERRKCDQCVKHEDADMQNFGGRPFGQWLRLEFYSAFEGHVKKDFCCASCLVEYMHGGKADKVTISVTATYLTEEQRQMAEKLSEKKGPFVLEHKRAGT